MELQGKVYDFGDRTIAAHLHAIADEVSEQACINGEDDPDSEGSQPLYDLADLLERLAGEVERLTTTLA